MESQGGRDEIDERRDLLQSDPLKITIASDLSALQVPANAQPKLHGELRVERGETVRDDAPGFLGEDDANAGDRAKSQVIQAFHPETARQEGE